MRLGLGMTIGFAALSALAACGPSEQAMRNTTREALLLGCRNGDPSARAQLNEAGIDMDRYCTCSVDRYLQPLNSEQLKQVANNPADVPGLEAAGRQCMSEMARAAPPLEAGNEAEPNAAASAAEENDAVDRNAEGNDTDGQ